MIPKWEFERERLPVDAYGWRSKPGATLEEQKAEMERFARLLGRVPTYFRCGGCESFHPEGYSGDCRNDLYRISDPDELHGPLGWEQMDGDADDPTVTCPACGGDGGFGDKGTCGYCEGNGRVPVDSLQSILDTMKMLGQERRDE